MTVFPLSIGTQGAVLFDAPLRVVPFICVSNSDGPAVSVRLPTRSFKKSDCDE